MIVTSKDMKHKPENVIAVIITFYSVLLCQLM